MGEFVCEGGVFVEELGVVDFEDGCGVGGVGEKCVWVGIM